MSRAVLVATVAMAMSAVPSFAQTSTGQTPSGTQKTATAKEHASTTKAGSDQHFVLEAAKGGLAEVELGKLALKAGNQAAAGSEFQTAIQLCDSDNDSAFADQARKWIK